MRQPSSPQSGFLLRASLSFAALLIAWWFALLPPLLGWTRLSTDFVLNAVPGAPLKTGVEVTPEGLWVLQAPVKVGGLWRNVRVETGRRLPTQLTIAMPLFWAILLAAPQPWRSPRRWLGGSALVLAIPPCGLLLYATHVVQLYVFPHSAPLLRAVIAVGDYVATTVAPYVGPVLIALAVHPELRRAVLEGDVLPPSEGGWKPPVAPGR
jgi:hypothetical protein